jgi:aldose 1-epimerase
VINRDNIFTKRNWVSDIIPNGVKFSLCSLDGEDGFPGEVWTECSYTLSSNSNDLIVEYTAVTDRPTPVDLTNHAYFNLNGHDSGTKVYNHTFKFAAEIYLDFDPVEMTVTGKLNSVKGTKYDFSDEVKLADRVQSGGKWPEEGYDNFFVVSNAVTDLKNVAT